MPVTVFGTADWAGERICWPVGVRHRRLVDRIGALGANGAPNARAETGGPGTRPCSATPKPIEPSGPIGTARASHCLHLDLPRAGNAPHQPKRVMSENGSERASTSGVNSTAAYSKADRDLSAMATGSHSDHAPVSIELGRICGPDETDDCEDGRQSEGAPTIANHRSPHTVGQCVHIHPKEKGFKQSPLALQNPPPDMRARSSRTLLFADGGKGRASARRCHALHPRSR